MRKIQAQQQRLAERQAKKEAEIAAMQSGIEPVNVVRMDAGTHAQFLAFQQHMLQQQQVVVQPYNEHRPPPLQEVQQQQQQVVQPEEQHFDLKSAAIVELSELERLSLSAHVDKDDAGMENV